MHRVQVAEVGISSSDGSTHRQSTVPMRVFESLDQLFSLDSMTSPDVGNQQGPSPSTTSQDVGDGSSIKHESFYPRVVCVVSKGSFPVTFFAENDYVTIKIPDIVGII